MSLPGGAWVLVFAIVLALRTAPGDGGRRRLRTRLRTMRVNGADRERVSVAQ